MAKHFTDETAEFQMPLSGKHAAPETSELDVTQKFDPGFSRRRPAVPAVPSWDNESR